MRFLTGPAIQKQVKKVTGRTGDLMVAVAYWGDGAAERTGLSHRKNPRQVRIVCDLLSGACSPDEIESMIRLGVRVKTLDRLHAKVWISGDRVILGSANASRNGLPNGDTESSNANIEAAVLSKDSDLSRRMTKWFEEQWRLAAIIDDDKLNLARRLWKRRRRSDGRAFTSTLIQKIRNPGPSDQFFRLRLIAYHEDSLSEDAEEFLRTRARFHYSEDEWQAHSDEVPCYEWPLDTPEWSPRPDTGLMDFTCSTERGKFTFNGFWKVRTTIQLSNTRVTLLTKLPHFDGYSLSPSGRARHHREDPALRRPEQQRGGRVRVLH